MKTLTVALVALLPVWAAIPEPDKGKSYGKPDAPVMVEVFSAFTCPHCKAFHDQIVPLLMRDFVKTGKIYLVNRDFPLNGPGHMHGRPAHAYANAAARIGRYEQVAGALWADQANWSVTGKVWEPVAKALSPDDQKRVQSLFKDPGVNGEVEREVQEGVAAGVNSTPTLVVTKGIRRIPVSRADNYNLLKSMLDDLLK